LAAKIDQTAEFECGAKWAIARSDSALGLATSSGKQTIDVGPPMEFPAPFGREMSKEEAYIADLDAKTGASLKLTILNGSGRVWTLVAGGGASVVYADAIASAGFASELANYGEYSGAPTESQTFHYAKTVLDLMLRAPQHPEGKVLFIGGGIANFTNVASTFKGVIKAIREVASQLNEHKVSIWVRRAGPNYQEGLKNIKNAASELNLDMHVSLQKKTRNTSLVLLLTHGRCSVRICTFQELSPSRWSRARPQTSFVTLSLYLVCDFRLIMSRLNLLVTKNEVFAFSLGHGYGWARKLRSYIGPCKVVYNME